MKVLHFDSQEARLAYVKKKMEEIVPEKPKKKRKKKDEVQAE